LPSLHFTHMRIVPIMESDSAVSIVRVGKQLGIGKFQVYSATCSDGKQLALKLFPHDERSSECFVREVSVHSKLSHPNIIRLVPHIKTVEFNADFDSLATEFAPFGNFCQLLTNKAITNEKLIRTFFRQLVQGLEYIHSQGYAHLDIKLDNLLLGQDFKLKIADFD
jgi:serine/threonine protein kinase